MDPHALEFYRTALQEQGVLQRQDGALSLLARSFKEVDSSSPAAHVKTRDFR